MAIIARRACAYDASPAVNKRQSLPARRSKRGNSYGNVADWLVGWLGGWMSVTAGIVSKRLNLS